MSNSTKLSAKERKRLQAILDSSYGDAFVNGSLAGGLGLGSLAAVYPATYAMTDLNPFRPQEEKWDVRKLNAQNVLGAGTSGFLVGAPIGGIVNTARLMLQKRKAKKLLGKTAAWQDYALNGGVGTAMGAGSGMLMNWALGRKLFDKRLLLGGALVGGGIGTSVGSLKSQQRKGYEAFQNVLKDCVQRDENGNIKRGKNNLPLMNTGIYYIKEHDAGAKSGPPGMSQAARDTMGHDIVSIFSDEKLDPAKYYARLGGTGDIKEHNVDMVELDNGQWYFEIELGVGRQDPSRLADPNNKAKIQDSHGNWEDEINTVQINNVLAGEGKYNKDDPRHIYDEEDMFRGGSGGAGNTLIHMANGEPATNNSFLAYKFTDDPSYNTPEKLQAAMQSMVSHGTLRDGKLTRWMPGGPILTNIIRALGMRGYDPATCMEFAKWVGNGLRSEDLLPQKFSDKYFSDRGAILAANDWENAGIGPFGYWEKTQDILDRQKAGLKDPDLLTPYYREGLPYIPDTIEWFKKMKKDFSDGFGINTQTNTDNNNG